jgi:hypothetical protein
MFEALGSIPSTAKKKKDQIKSNTEDPPLHPCPGPLPFPIPVVVGTLLSVATIKSLMCISPYSFLGIYLHAYVPTCIQGFVFPLLKWDHTSYITVN